jgi:flagellar biosynthesis component FlhA
MGEYDMTVLGVILLIIGFVVGIPLLTTIGLILLLIGLALWIMGRAGHAVGGRHHYF